MRKTCKSIHDCPKKKKVALNKNGYEILECTKCSHRFCQIDELELHLEKVYSDDYFFEGKSGYPDYLREKDILINHGNRYAKMMSKFIDKPGTVLDVGSAAGFILQGFKEEGWACQGIEPNRTMAEYGKEEFDIDVQIGGLESFHTDKQFDLITLISVIGHFQDLDLAIKNVQNLLKPNGYVLVESWNRNSLITRILGKHWHAYCPPSVVHWFSDRTIIDFFEFYGFQIVKKGLPFKRIKLGHGISLIDTNTPNFFFKTQLFDFLSKSMGKVKLIYPPVDVKWYIFKKKPNHNSSTL